MRRRDRGDVRGRRLRLLLDTHILLWAANFENFESSRLSNAAVELIRDPANAPCFSAVSIWEVAIKFGRKRPGFDVDPQVFRSELLANGYTEVAVTGRHAAAVARLPDLHKDPFDRLLAAQAGVEGLLLVTADSRLGAYPGPIRRV